MSIVVPKNSAPAVDVLGTWRIGLLRAVLLFVGIAMVLGSVSSLVAIGGGLALVAPYLAVAASTVLMWRVAPFAPRAVSAVVMVAGTGVTGYLLYSLGWPPAMGASLCVTLVFSTLLMGPMAAGVVLVATAGMFLAGSLAVMGGGFVPEWSASVDPTSQAHWIRVGFIWLLVAGGGTIVLRFAARALTEKQHQLAAAVAELKAELALAEAADATRRQVEAALGRAQKLGTLAQLGRGFSHVFNNVLTVLRSAVAEARIATSESGRRASLGSVQQAISTSVDRAQDILTLARHRPVAAAEMGLDDWLVAVGPSMSARLMSHLELKVMPGSEAIIRATADGLEQVLLNLLLNAQQATPDGGVVTVSAHRERLAEVRYTTIEPLDAGDYAVIRVADSGHGMTGEVAARAFEPFFTTFGMDSHDGLGLTVAHHIIRGFGGSAEILRSQGGTTVAIYLPVAADAPRSVSSGDKALAGDAATGWSQTLKSVALRKMIRANAIVLFLALAIGSPLVDSDAERWEMLAMAGSATLLLAFVSWRRPNYSSERLAKILVAVSLVTGAATVTRFTFLAAGPVVYLTYSVFLAGLFLNRRGFVSVLVAAFLAFIIGSIVHGQGLLSITLSEVDSSVARNWMREGVASIALASLTTAAAAYLPLALGKRIADLARAQSQLREARARREQASRASVDLGAMRKRAETMEATGHLTATVAHDINNSLQAVVLAEELIGEQPGDDGLVDFALGEIERASDHIEALVNQLDVGAGRLEADAIGVDLSIEIPAMVHMLKALLKQAGGLALTLPSDGGALPVGLASQRFRQLLLNLVANARDALEGRKGSQGQCHVRARREGEFVLLEVEDNGAGMTPSTMARALDPFYTTKPKGTGLGLHSVSNLVTAAGGRVSLTSQFGEGTRVRLWLPCIASTRPVPVALAPEPAEDRQGGSLLLVDDDPNVRSILAVGLTRAGYHVVEAANGDEALAAIASKTRLSALCSDAVMPGAPVAKVVANFRERYPGRPVVVISGYLPDEVRRRLGDSSTRILQKPFTGAALAAALDLEAAASERHPKPPAP